MCSKLFISRQVLRLFESPQKIIVIIFLPLGFEIFYKFQWRYDYLDEELGQGFRLLLDIWADKKI